MLAGADNLSGSRLGSLERLSLALNRIVRLPALALLQLKELDMSGNLLESA